MASQPKNPKASATIPDTPAAVAAPMQPTLAETASALERATAEVAAKTREADEARRVLGLVQSDPKATEEQRQDAWDAFDIARGRLSRAESEVESVRGVHADLLEKDRAAQHAAEDARTKAMVASVSEELEHFYDDTPAAIREAFAHFEAGRAILLKERARLVEGNAKQKSIERYLPKDAKGYPSIPPSDGTRAGGAFATCLLEAGGTLHTGNWAHLVHLFDLPVPSRPDPDAHQQCHQIVEFMGGSLTQGKKSLAMYGKEHHARPLLARAAEVLPRHRVKREAAEETEALDRADYEAMQAKGREEQEGRLAAAALKRLQAQRRGNPVVDINGKPPGGFKAPEAVAQFITSETIDEAEAVATARGITPVVLSPTVQGGADERDPTPLDDIEVPKVS